MPSRLPESPLDIDAAEDIYGCKAAGIVRVRTQTLPSATYLRHLYRYRRRTGSLPETSPGPKGVRLRGQSRQATALQAPFVSKGRSPLTRP